MQYIYPFPNGGYLGGIQFLAIIGMAALTYLLESFGEYLHISVVYVPRLVHMM